MLIGTQNPRQFTMFSHLNTCYVRSLQMCAADRDVEAAEAVAGQRVRAALQHDGPGVVRVDDMPPGAERATL